MRHKDCLSDNELIDLFQGEMSRSQAASRLSHVALCPICSFRFDFLYQIRKETESKISAFAEANSPADPLPLLQQAARRKLAGLAPSASATTRLTPRPRSRLHFRFAFGILGIFLLVISAGYLAFDHIRPRSSLRSPDLKLTLLEPVGQIRHPPATFRWTPVVNAEGYYLELIDDRLQPVFNSSTYLVPEHIIPLEVQTQIVRGRTYVWSIKALDSDGNLLHSESGHFRLD